MRYKYINVLKEMNVDQIGENEEITLVLEGEKNSFMNLKDSKKKFIIVTDPETVKNEKAIYVMPFNQTTIQFLEEHPEFIENHKIWLINPKSINEKIYPINVRYFEKINKKEIKRIIKAISKYIDIAYDI